MTEPYNLRGQRVAAKGIEEIALVAKIICTALKITKPMDMAQFMERLPYESGIYIEVEEDRKWIVPAEALCDPSKLRIIMPESLYRKICKRSPKAMGILFHELGHIVLGHRPLLSYANTPPCEAEDAEWQADTFMEAVIQILKISLLPMQMEFDF